VADLVVTVPKHFWADWIDEGDAVGEPTSNTEWGFFLGSGKPAIVPGERLYIVAHGLVRGYAPVTRLAFFPEPCSLHIEDEPGCERCHIFRDENDYPSQPKLKNGTRIPGRWAIGRRGGAVAMTIPQDVKGFQGWRKRWWDRSAEKPFPMWEFARVPAKMATEILHRRAFEIGQIPGDFYGDVMRFVSEWAVAQQTNTVIADMTPALVERFRLEPGDAEQLAIWAGGLYIHWCSQIEQAQAGE
jgi:hypothetical protein